MTLPVFIALEPAIGGAGPNNVLCSACSDLLLCLNSREQITLVSGSIRNSWLKVGPALLTLLCTYIIVYILHICCSESMFDAQQVMHCFLQSVQYHHTCVITTIEIIRSYSAQCIVYLRHCVFFVVVCEPLFVFWYFLYSRSTGGGYAVLPLSGLPSVCPSFRPPQDMFRRIFLSNY